MNHIAVSPDIEPVPDTTALRTRLLAGISFGLAGLLLNLCDVELLPGISLLFGSILSLFTLLRYGPVAGLIATLLASSSTLLLFGHAWTLLLSTVELLAVTWLLRQRRIEPVLAMLCYWALFGWLLSFGVHYYFVETSLADARLLALKQAVNGTFNMMAAQSAYLLSRRLLEHKPEPVKIHTLLFTIIGLAAVVPIMIHMVLDVRSSYRAAVQSLQRDVEHAEVLTTALMREWLDERKQAVQAVARLVELAHTQDTNHLRYMLIEAVAGDGPLTRLLLLDANNRVLALGVRPGVHAEVRVGQDMSRVAFAELLKTRKNLQIIDLFNGKGGGSLPRIAAVVPVWKHGRYQRGVVATFDFDSLRELLKKVAGQHRVDITLLDGQNLIIASTRPELVTMEPYQQLAGAADNTG